MVKARLISAILTGNKAALQQALPQPTIISHTEIKKAFLWLSENTLPPGASYSWEPMTNPEELLQVLTAFDCWFSDLQNKQNKAFKALPVEYQELFHRVYEFFCTWYSKHIEEGRYESLSHSGEGWRKKAKLIYKPYYA